MHLTTLRNDALALFVLLAVGTLAACSPEADGTDRPAVVVDNRPCSTPADSIIGLATKRFIQHVSPKPHRFLVPEATDSAIPTSAYWALQGTPATLNMYPRDTAKQRTARAQLSPKNSLIMLLVSYHGQRKLADGRTALDFSGHYMGGDVDGQSVPRTTIAFSCHAEGERFVIDAAAPPA
jgi:hypothetical protein